MIKNDGGFNFKVVDFDADENTNMEIRTIEVGGFMSMFCSLRMPYGKHPRAKGMCDFYFDNGTMNYGALITPDDKDIELAQKLILRGDEHAKPLRGIIAWARITAPIYLWWELEQYVVGRQRLFSESTMNDECKSLQGEELQEARRAISFGRVISKVDCFSYQTLRRICSQRANHRLPEWHEFIDWVHTLPLAEELIFVGL